MNRALRIKLTVGLAIAAGVTLVVAANWQFIALAFSSDPGCVAIDPARAAAKPGC